MENRFLFHAFLLGIYITFVYDLLRILRRVFPHGNGLISLEDFCFWVYCGVEVFLLMYHESNGTLRWFAVMGAVLGMVLYGKCVSPPLVKYTALLLRKLLHLCGRLFYFLTTPLRFLGRRLAGLLGILGRNMRQRRRRLAQKGNNFIKKKLTYLRKVLRI